MDAQAVRDRRSEFESIFATEDRFRAWYDVAARRLYAYLVGRCGGDGALVEELTQQSFVNALRKLPADPIGGIGGAPVVVFIDGKTTPTTAFESTTSYPCKQPAPPEDTICLIPVSTKARTVKP